MLPAKTVKGRGAPSNHSSQRFNNLLREVDCDWLDMVGEIDGAPPNPRTTVTEERPASVLTFNTSPDLPFDRSVNAYRGCEHGCIYCYARPTHAYHDLSPGLDFETRLFAKPSAAAVLKKTIANPSYRAAPIAIGTNTDPYQPIEARYEITRQILKLMVETRHPIVITTKSNRITRDIDLLKDLAADNLTGVAISVTTLETTLAQKLEPRAPAPIQRLRAVRALADAGVYVHVNISPIIPAITDGEIEAIVQAASEYGANSVSWIPVRLPHEVAPLFREWLQLHFPDRAKRVMHIVQDLRGGKDNDPNFGSRMRGQGVWAQLIKTRMRIACHKYGLAAPHWNIRSDLFVPPSLDGQTSLF
jgi:DNA repair photolyase